MKDKLNTNRQKKVSLKSLHSFDRHEDIHIFRRTIDVNLKKHLLFLLDKLLSLLQVVSYLYQGQEKWLAFDFSFASCKKFWQFIVKHRLLVKNKIYVDVLGALGIFFAYQI